MQKFKMSQQLGRVVFPQDRPNDIYEGNHNDHHFRNLFALNKESSKFHLSCTFNDVGAEPI